MRNTIESLWNGAITPGERCGADNPQIEKIQTLIERHKDSLNSELGQPLKTVFEKYTGCVEEYICLICEQAFCDGFCLASKLLTEALSGEME